MQHTSIDTTIAPSFDAGLAVPGAALRGDAGALPGLAREALDEARRAGRDAGRLLRVLMIAGAPCPWRAPVMQRLSEMPGIRFRAVFCCRVEPQRYDDPPPLDFEHEFLRERHAMVRGRCVHNNPDVVAALRRFRPDIVITTGTAPTYLYALAWARLHGAAHVAMTDDTDVSEHESGGLRRLVRRHMLRAADACIASSAAGLRLLRGYGMSDEDCFLSCLPADGKAMRREANAAPVFDVLVQGRLDDAGRPMFALDAAADAARRLGRLVRILFVGHGPHEAPLRRRAAELDGLVEAHFLNFPSRSDLQRIHAAARVLLQPGHRDPWGLPASLACAAGLPVITTPQAGCAGELVIHEENGFVHELDQSTWGEAVARLLGQPGLHARFADRSRTIAGNYSFERAADGIVAACRQALANRARRRRGQQGGGAPRVVIVERQLLHYREAVYEQLRELLRRDGIEMQLLIGEGTPDEKKKKDEAKLDWPIRIPTRYLFNYRVCWQPFPEYARNAEMVIVGHENKMIYNLWLMSFGRPKRLAFWGHGRNMQSQHPDGLRERFKRWTINKVDWWFAYTDSSAALVSGAGFPGSRITVVDNAIDTRELKAQCDAVTAADKAALRRRIGFSDGPVGIYVGSLYQEKRLDFLLDAAQRIRSQVPGFQLVVVGAGPDQHVIEEAARLHPWIHYAGQRTGRDKAELLALADVMLNPGLVGLGILDSFVGACPMFTTDCGLHSPEISYMVSGQNGVMTENTIEAYADAVSRTLSDPALLARLQQGALTSASRYTIENMAMRLRNGILACIRTV